MEILEFTFLWGVFRTFVINENRYFHCLRAGYDKLLPIRVNRNHLVAGVRRDYLKVVDEIFGADVDFVLLVNPYSDQYSSGR